MNFLRYDIVFQVIILFSCLVTFILWLFTDMAFSLIYIFSMGTFGLGLYQLLVSNTIHYQTVNDLKIKKLRYWYKIVAMLFLLTFIIGLFLIVSRERIYEINSFLRILWVSPVFLCSYFWICLKDWQARSKSI